MKDYDSIINDKIVCLKCLPNENFEKAVMILFLKQEFMPLMMNAFSSNETKTKCEKECEVKLK